MYGSYGVVNMTTDSKPDIYAAFHAVAGVHTVGNMNINASRGSTIYGKSNTVQPSALTVFPLIKF